MHQVWTALGQRVHGNVRQGRARADIQILKLVTVHRQGLARPVGYLLAVLQVQQLDVVAKLREGGEGRVANRLATAETQFAQETATSEITKMTSLTQGGTSSRGCGRWGLAQPIFCEVLR